MATIKEAKSNDEIAQCLPVLSELRGHFKVDNSQFVERVQQQRKKGYHLVYLEDQGKIQAIAGYRIRDTLETPEPRYAKQCCLYSCCLANDFTDSWPQPEEDMCQNTGMPKLGGNILENSSCIAAAASLTIWHIYMLSP